MTVIIDGREFVPLDEVLRLRSGTEDHDPEVGDLDLPPPLCDCPRGICELRDGGVAWGPMCAGAACRTPGER